MPTYILYFGSFNPVHNGHITLAQTLLEQGIGHEVWFVVSPLNPFKNDSELWPQEYRAKLLQNAIKDHEQLKVCTIEFTLPQPSYTIQTLKVLWRLHPDKEFDILMGEDNLAGLHLWKEYDSILQSCHIYVYPRKESSVYQKTTKPDPLSRKYPALSDYPQKIHLLDMPVLNISSTQIRDYIKRGIDVSDMVPFDTQLLKRNLYDKS